MRASRGRGFHGAVLARRLYGFVFLELAIAGTEFGAGIRVEKFGKAWILRQILEVRIIARLETKLRFQAKSLIEPAQRILDMAGEAIERRQPVDYVLSLRALLQQLFQVLARSDVVPQVHQRDGVVEVLLSRLELCSRGPFQMLIADAEVNHRAVGELLAGSGDH